MPNYLMKVAIDFGSTNTVMAWRIYDATADFEPLGIAEKLNPENNIQRVPTVMILQADNPDLEKNLFGLAAAEKIKNGNAALVVRDNFKQKLYTAAGSEEYSDGKKLAKKFFEHLREVYYNEIYKRLPDGVKENMRGVLYLSTPVRADPTHRTLMREIAEAAGFTTANGIYQISTDADEALCVVKYALDNDDKKNVQAALRNAADAGSVLLFVDVGGSTTDMILESVKIDGDGQISVTPQAWWPSPDVDYPLGGCLIDEAIRDYLIRAEFAHPDYTMKKWDAGDGKFRFRVFKEENNRILKGGKKIMTLGNLRNVIENRKQLAPADYDDEPTIDAAVFENEICNKYIEAIPAALAELFASQRDAENPIAPEDVDMIFLTGAGSNLYFIKDIFLREELHLDKIRAHKEFLFANWKDPSLCCALGALVELKNADMPNYSKGNYGVGVEVFVMSDGERRQFEKGTVNPATRALEKNFFITKKFQKLPVKLEANAPVSFVYNDSIKHMALRIHLFRVDDDGREIVLGTPRLQFCSTNFMHKLKNFAIEAARITGNIATLTVSGIDNLLGSNLGRRMRNGINSAASRARGEGKTFSMRLKLNLELSESSRLTANAEIVSEKIFNGSKEYFQMNL